jgi:hypothetical protein
MADQHRAHRWRWVALAVLVTGLILAAAGPAAASVQLPPGQIPIPESGTFLYMNSEPGDYIGGGVEQLYTSADSQISASLFGGHFGAFVNQADFTHWWHVEIAAPDGGPLLVAFPVAREPRPLDLR